MLTSDHQKQLRDNGFVVVPDVLDVARDIEPIIDEFTIVIDRLAVQLYQSGRIDQRFGDLPFGPRLLRIMQATGESHSQHFDCCLPKGGVTAATPMWLGEAVFNVIVHEKLLDCVESVIGSEIFSNPVQHVRLKPPESLAPGTDGKSVTVGETPWHQDNGVLTQDADQTEMLTVWIPLVDATVENGCLIAIPGSHRRELIHHCSGAHGQLSIPEQLIDPNAAQAIPMRRGEILMFHRKLVHASRPNESAELRCSIDLRYHPAHQPSGRSMFPGFVARSRTHPDRVLRDRDQWERLWFETRARMAAADYDEESFDRWTGDHPSCA